MYSVENMRNSKLKEVCVRVYNIHVQYCVYMFTCITLCLLCLCFVLQVRNHWKSSRFFYGKNRVIQAALGRTEAEEYKVGLARVAKVYNHVHALGVLCCFVLFFFRLTLLASSFLLISH